MSELDDVLAQQAMAAGFTASATTEPVAEPAPQPAEEPEAKLPEKPLKFDERYKEPFTGLLYLGYLEKTVHLFGHEFSLVTPTQAQRLQVGPLIKDYADTPTGEAAFTAAFVASYLVAVDRQSLPEPILKNERDDSITHRFTWVLENLRQPVINAIFEYCMNLEADVDGVLEAMGKA